MYKEEHMKLKSLFNVVVIFAVILLGTYPPMC